jgi:hypothetical protein
MTRTSWIEELLKDFPEIYDNEETFSILETFEYDRKKKAIKKRMHNKRKTNEN